jgi:hypothetical protein
MNWKLFFGRTGIGFPVPFGCVELGLKSFQLEFLELEPAVLDKKRE